MIGKNRNAVVYVFSLKSQSAGTGRKSALEAVFVPTMILIGLLAVVAFIAGIVAGAGTILYVLYFLAYNIWIAYGLVAYVAALLIYALIVVIRALFFRPRPTKQSSDFLLIDDTGLQMRIRRTVRQQPWSSIREIIWRPGRLSIIDKEGVLEQFDVALSHDFDASEFLTFCRERIDTADR